MTITSAKVIHSVYYTRMILALLPVFFMFSFIFVYLCSCNVVFMVVVWTLRFRFYNVAHYCRFGFSTCSSSIMHEIAFETRTNLIKPHCSTGYKVARVAEEFAGQQIANHGTTLALFRF